MKNIFHNFFMSINKAFIFFVISFLVGVFISNILFSFELILIFFSVTLFFLFLLLIIIKKHHFFILIMALGIFVGGIYSGINNYYIGQKLSRIEELYGKNVLLKAEVGELYKKGENNNSYILKVIFINEETNFSINLLLYTQKNLTLESGQTISINSKIIKIDNFIDNFNYIKFMQSKNIYFQVYAPNIEFLEKKDLGVFGKFIVNFRQKLLSLIYEIYPKNEASFLAGILIGAKEDFSENLKTNFNNSGLTHLVAVSGFNITIIIIFLGFLFKFFPIILRTIIIFLFVIFFVLIVGENVAVLRAGIMGLVGYFILVSGRKADSLSLLLFTSLVLVLFNPLYLNYDVSFHLSFLAVLGLLYFQEFWGKVFRFLPSFFAVKESFVLTMSALTTTLPIMIFNFGQVSILAPITNMLVGGVIPFAMFFGFLSILGQTFLDKIGFILGFVNYFLLKYVILIAEYFGNLDFAVYKLDLGIYSIYAEIIYFMILVFLIIYFRQEKSPKLEN